MSSTSGVTGRDLALDSRAPIREVLGLGFGHSAFRYAGPAERDWAVADIAGRRVATAYPRLVADDLAEHGISATVIRLDGAVEISVQLGLADVVADVVGSGRTLQQHGLVAFGEVICRSEAVLIARSGVAAVSAPPVRPGTTVTPTTLVTPMSVTTAPTNRRRRRAS